MPDYTESSALQAYRLSLSEIDNVLPHVASGSSIDPDVRNYVLCGAILFLNAKLENYISDLFKGICQKSCQRLASPQDLPPELLGWMFLADGHLDRSRNFIAQNDEYTYIQGTGQYLTDTLILNPASCLTVDKFKNIDDKSYPSVKNLKKMFRRIGIQNIFHLLTQHLERDVEAEIKSLNAVRGSLAHVGISGQISFQEVTDLVSSVTQVVESMDVVTCDHLTSICTTDIWT